MDSPNTFDRMVSGISQEERKSLLSRMQSQELPNLPSNDTAESVEAIVDTELPDLETSLKKEPIWFRFWLWFKALIKSDSVQNVYNNELIHDMVNHLQRNVPNLIDYKRKYLLETFYNSLVEVKHCIDFFKPYVSKSISTYSVSLPAFSQSLIFCTRSDRRLCLPDLDLTNGT